LMSWTFYFLARHPDIYAKLRDAVLQDFGSNDTAAIDYAELMTCKYLRFVIDEVLCLAANAPMVERACKVDTILPRGGHPKGSMPILVPQGSMLYISISAIQLRADLWGPGVGEFNPERWHGRGFGWEFVPFRGGSRKYIGRISCSVLYSPGL